MQNAQRLILEAGDAGKLHLHNPGFSWSPKPKGHTKASVKHLQEESSKLAIILNYIYIYILLVLIANRAAVAQLALLQSLGGSHDLPSARLGV